MTGHTISNTYTTGYTLTDTAKNPLNISSSASITITGSLAAFQAVLGTYWTIGNGGMITGNYVGVSLAGSGTLANTGHISASQTTSTTGGYSYNKSSHSFTPLSGGVLMGGGGVSNASAAVINGYFEGIALGGGGTVVNAGTILSASTTTGFGIVLTADGSVSNASTGTISAGRYGILTFGSGATTVNNNGVIVSQKGVGVDLFGGGTLTNASGTITGATYGVVMAGTAASTVTNHATIAGQSNAGVDLVGGGTLSNAASGVITGGGIYGVVAHGAATITNNGSIASQTDAGVALRAGGTVTNGTGAVIKGPHYGVVVTTGIGTLTNQGTISATMVSGVLFTGGGYVSNASTGTITGKTFGIEIQVAGGSVNNLGSVSSSAIYATRPFDSAGVDLAAGGTVTNGVTGNIRSTWKGVEIGSTTSSIGGTVLNQGTIFASNIAGNTGAAVWIHGPAQISNAASGTITGGPFGIVTYFQTTVTNYGTISGSQFAVDNSTAGFANRVIDEPGSRFVGTVTGGNTIGSSIVSTLELASTASKGTLTGLGTQFIDFGQVAVDAGASWTLTSTDTIAAGVTLTELGGATVTSTGTLANNGSILIDPSTMTLGGLSGTGSATIAAGSTLDVSGGIASGETIRFGGTGSYLYLGNPGSATGSVTNFDVGEAILLHGVTASSVTYSSGTLTFAGGSFDLSLAAGGTPNVTTTTKGAEFSLLCFCTDTHILTPSGERRVQELAVGDMVTTHRGDARRIEWIGSGKVLATRGRRNAATPVIVRKGALADNVPCRDLRVTKGHSLYLDDVLIPVEFLVNHRSIVWDDRAQEIALYHIELATHDVLLADGAPAESYRDDGNRWLFQNANCSWDMTPRVSCAPVLTGGPLVDAAWRRVLDRAGPRPGMPTMDQPDLHLLVDGQRVDGKARPDGVFVFRLPMPPEEIRIVSRAAVPEELGTSRDPRCLGVALRSVMLWNGPRVRIVEADDERLADGFHMFEPDNGWRWTDGNAALPEILFEGMTGVLTVELHVACTTQYLDDRDASQAA